MTVDNLLDHDFNPLFMLLDTKSWSAVLQQLQANPSLAKGAIKMAGFYGVKKITTTANALHIACKHNAPIDVIKAFLIQANSHAASEKDSSYQRLPLHIATLNQCSSRVVGALVKEYLKAVKIQDVHGRLPIHYACKDRVNGERTLQHLLKVYLDSAHVADDQGFLPLHVACRSSMLMVVINMLLRVAPESILAKTNNGATPVHCAKNVKGGTGST
jgi:ankyrin repeat protein